MSKVELLGKQENGRDALLSFTLDTYPRTVDEWIKAAYENNVNFDETVTREKGVHLGQFSQSGGYVQAGDTLEEFVDAQERIKAAADKGKTNDLSSVRMALSVAKNKMGYTTEDWRKIRNVTVTGPHGTDREAHMKRIYSNTVDNNVKSAVNWDKVDLPEPADKNVKQALVRLPGDETLWLVVIVLN